MNYLNSLFTLTGHRVVITGAAGLLGQVFCKAIGHAGAEVYLLDIEKTALEAVNQHLLSMDIKSNMVVVDITNQSRVTQVIDDIAQDGPVHGLINSAAVDPKFESDSTNPSNSGEFTSYSLENWERSLRVNLTGMFLVTQAVCRIMETQPEAKGSIVNIASTYGLTGPDQRIYETGQQPRFYKPVDYSVTKAGVLGFTRAVAAYYRKTNIRVNALSPGGAYDGHDPDFVQNYSARTILDRMAQPDEYAAAIVFLCSSASSYMTGSNLIIDGGWTAL